MGEVLESVRDVEACKLEVVGSLRGHVLVEFYSLTEIRGHHLLVAGACAEDSHQVVGCGVGGVDSGESALGLAVVLVENLGEGGIVALVVSESLNGSLNVALLEIEETEGGVEVVEAGSLAKRVVGGAEVVVDESYEALVHLRLGSVAVKTGSFLKLAMAAS